uniref:trypsin n=1 Tax=Neogobius melanostomus TaxID=47308 RepID=A0A8C6TS08_9GOBI
GHYLLIFTHFFISDPVSCNNALIVTGSLIVKGNKVEDVKAMQYMVSVQAQQSHRCGGFLVSANFVLTAARCSDHLDKVVLGSHNLDDSKKQKIGIEEQIKHPSYEEENNENNLMLLKLKENAKLGEGVEIIKLPNETMKVKVGDRCEIAGWGATDEKVRTHVKDLYATKVSIIDRPRCMKEWPELPENVICAVGNNGIRTFEQVNTGDRGGPLVCDNIAVGIASFNRIKEIEGPNVFIDISKYLEWINQNMTKNNMLK